MFNIGSLVSSVRRIGSLILTKAQEVAALGPVFWGDTSEAYAKSKFAVALDGSNDYLDCPVFDDYFDGVTDKSWTFNTIMYVNNGDSMILSQKSGNWSIYIFILGGGTGLRCQVRDVSTGGYKRANASGSLSLNTWIFLSVVYDASIGEFKVYINSVDQNVTTTTTGTYVAVEPVSNLTIGQFLSSSYFDGDLDQVTFFNKALSSSEITALYNSGNGVHHKDLVGTESYYSSIAAWYDFNTIQNFGRDYHGESHAVSLDGSKKLTLPYQSGGAFDRAFNEPWSFVTWAKPSAVAGGYDRWLNKYDASTGKYIESYNTTGTSFVFFINESSTNRIVVTFTTTFDVTNQFVHLAFTYDGSTNASGLKMFLNGVEQTSKTVTSDTLTATTRLAVDTDFGSASEHTFDELSIYHDELTSTEVATLYNGGIVAPARTLHTDNLVSDYSFNEQNFELIGRDAHGSSNLTPVSIVESDLVGGKDSLDLTEVSIDSSNAVLGHIEGAAAGSDEVTKWTDRSASGFDVVQSTIADAATYIGNGFGTKGSLKDGELDINPEPFNFSGDFAIGCWFKQDALTQFRFPIGVWGSTGSRSFGIRNGSGGAGIQFAVSHDGSVQSNTAITDKPITAGEWYFGFGWHENGVQIGFRMWDIRGQEIGVAQLDPHTTGAFNSTSPFRIGGHTNEWNGQVGDVYVFDKLLTYEEQQKLLDYSLESIAHEGFISELGMEVVMEQADETQISELGIEVVLEEV